MVKLAIIELVDPVEQRRPEQLGNVPIPRARGQVTQIARLEGLDEAALLIEQEDHPGEELTSGEDRRVKLEARPQVGRPEQLPDRGNERDGANS